MSAENWAHWHQTKPSAANLNLGETAAGKTHPWSGHRARGNRASKAYPTPVPRYSGVQSLHCSPVLQEYPRTTPPSPGWNANTAAQYNDAAAEDHPAYYPREHRLVSRVLQTPEHQENGHRWSLPRDTADLEPVLPQHAGGSHRPLDQYGATPDKSAADTIASNSSLALARARLFHPIVPAPRPQPRQLTVQLPPP